MFLTSWLSAYRRPSPQRPRFLKRQRRAKPDAWSAVDQFEARVLLSGTPLELTGVFSDDSYIKGSANEEETNYGSELTVNVDAAPDIAGIFKFDTSSLLPGTALESVSLTFQVSDASAGTWEIYQVLKPWNESLV